MYHFLSAKRQTCLCFLYAPSILYCMSEFAVYAYAQLFVLILINLFVCYYLIITSNWLFVKYSAINTTNWTVKIMFNEYLLHVNIYVGYFCVQGIYFCVKHLTKTGAGSREKWGSIANCDSKWSGATPSSSKLQSESVS